LANFIYNEFKRALAAGEVDWDSSDVRVLLAMTNTTANTEDDANTIAGFTTLDEFDGSGYSTGGVALTGEALSENSGQNRAEADANDAAFGPLGAGTRQVQGAIVYVYLGSLGASLPAAWIDSGGFPFTANGANVTIQWNAGGIIQIA